MVKWELPLCYLIVAMTVGITALLPFMCAAGITFWFDNKPGGGHDSPRSLLCGYAVMGKQPEPGAEDFITCLTITS